MYVRPPEPLLMKEKTDHFRLLVYGSNRQWGVCSLICKSNRSAVEPENHSTQMACHSCNCPLGLLPIPCIGQFKPISLLPDERLVSVARDGTLLTYNRDNPDNVRGVVLGNLFASLPAEHNVQNKQASYHRSIS